MTVATAVRTFVLQRHEDISGVSGLGIVAEGVEFSSGQCVLHWLVGGDDTIGVYRDIQTVEKIHGHGGSTVVEWV